MVVLGWISRSRHCLACSLYPGWLSWSGLAWPGPVSRLQYGTSHTYGVVGVCGAAHPGKRKTTLKHGMRSPDILYGGRWTILYYTALFTRLSSDALQSEIAVQSSDCAALQHRSEEEIVMAVCKDHCLSRCPNLDSAHEQARVSHIQRPMRPSHAGRP